MKTSQISESLNAVLGLQPQWSAATTPTMKDRGELIRNKIPDILRGVLTDISHEIADLKVQGKDGVGLKNRVPWVRLFSAARAPRATSGFYLVFLFSFDGSAVYLSLNQGVFGESSGPRSGLPDRVSAQRDLVRQKGTSLNGLDETISLHDPGGKGDAYEAGNIFAIKYTRGVIPDDEHIAGDLARMLSLLKSLYSTNAVTPSSSRHWIFQGNPDQFDVDGYIRSRQEILWSVRQHKDRILVGDRVLLWRSGATGGVIADCSVIAPPSTEIFEDAPELWKVKPDTQAGEMRCRLRVGDSFVDAPIARSAIRAVLPDLSIVKVPQGTNFEITQTDYENIMSLKESTIASLPFDSAALSLALLAIEATHMRIERAFLNRFVTSLIAKPFLILTGNSGTGKTKLAELFVQWLCRSVSSQFVIVPVGADWTDNRNVLGFVNHLRVTSLKEAGAEINLPVYQTTKILDLLLDACRKENEGKPFFLILDEMNLSHVERYFADFLSTMESKESRLLLHREGRPLPRKQGGPCDVPEALVLPRNVFVIGTVNVDETTYMFSPKVLDRANVIEFRVDTDAPVGFLKSGGRSIGEVADASAGYAQGFLELSLRARNKKGTALALVADPDVPPVDAQEGIERCHATITDLFMLMQKRHQEFAFRTMAEILRFLAVDYELKPAAEVWNWEIAMDAQILQKVLPKLHGSKRKIGSLLAALAKYCEQGNHADAEVLLMDETKAEAYLAAEDKREKSPAFKESYIKLCEMMEAVRRDQFVSFIQ